DVSGSLLDQTTNQPVKNIPNEGLPVTYTINSGTSQTVMTDTQGNYMITDVPYGASVVITPPEVDLYTRLTAPITLSKVTEDSPNNNFYYKAVPTIYIRQVVLNPAAAVQQPNMGYFTLLDSGSQLYSLTGISGLDNTAAGYTKYTLTPTSDGKYTLTDIIPQYYKYIGYQVSSTDGNYDSSGMKTDAGNGNIPLTFTPDSATQWLTVYIQPISDTVENYQWSSAENDVGTINPSDGTSLTN
ncbi:MAG: hypothetical protein LBI03_11585, partial [Clostridiales bacterium]|nr:hypothetical protein [Clostridiales bacterium]